MLRLWILISILAMTAASPIDKRANRMPFSESQFNLKLFAMLLMLLSPLEY
jgi:hypothetical protein